MVLANKSLDSNVLSKLYNILLGLGKS